MKLNKSGNLSAYTQRDIIFYFEVLIIVGASCIPLFFNLPYRDNIYLSWEGAYRLYLGQIPYQDFGLPLGFGFWIIPALFFKIFGPFLFTLIKAQVLINILSLFAFRNILKILKVDEPKILLAICIFIFSYSFPNFWPWYNHTVFVFQLISFNLILIPLFKETKRKSLYIILGSFFAFLSFYTKQDSGAIAIAFGGAIILYHCICEKQFNLLVIYVASLIGFAAIFIIPFLQSDFLYWFNYGQPPHNSRLHINDFLNKIFGESEWEKFYLLSIVLVILNNFRLKDIFIEKQKYIFLFITIGVIIQALVIKVTSPLPTGHTTYFHAFAFAFLVSSISFKINFNLKQLAFILVFVFAWWSSIFWGYAERIFKNTKPETSINTSNSIDIKDNPGLIQTSWKTSDLKAFKHIKLPTETIEGIYNILALEVVKNKDNLKVLNMSEITPLAYEIGYTPKKNQPLWYHLNIGMFEKQVKSFNERIKNKEYDLVLFQPIPDLDNFFPYGVQEELKLHYKLVDTFEAPRKRTEGYSYIEVYIKPE